MDTLKSVVSSSFFLYSSFAEAKDSPSEIDTSMVLQCLRQGTKKSCVVASSGVTHSVDMVKVDRLGIILSPELLNQAEINRY